MQIAEAFKAKDEELKEIYKAKDEEIKRAMQDKEAEIEAVRNACIDKIRELEERNETEINTMKHTINELTTFKTQMAKEFESFKKF